MWKRIDKDNLLFCGVQSFIWSGFGVYFGFFVPYLKNNGFSEINIGILMSTLSFVGIFSPILWAAVSDRMKNPKWMLAANIVAGCVAAQFVPSVITRYGLLLALLVVINLTITAQPPVLDGWVMRLRSHGAQINYGLSRGTGSLAYALTSMICGLVFAQHGMGLMFPLFLGLECMAALLILLVRNRQEPVVEITVSADVPEGKEVPLIKNANYILYVSLATVLFIGVSAVMTFYPVLLMQAGGTNADLGLALGLMALSEFPVMFFSSRLLRRFKDTTLLMVAIAGFALRIFLFYTMDTVSSLVWCQLTQSLSYGIFLPTSVHYITRIASGKKKATALSVASSMYMGVGGIIGSFLGGVIIETFNIRVLFAGAAVIAAVVAIAFTLLQLRSGSKASKQALAE